MRFYLFPICTLLFPGEKVKNKNKESFPTDKIWDSLYTPKRIKTSGY
jgi:hypothetical protein